MVFVFAAAFLVPNLYMPATAAAAVTDAQILTKAATSIDEDSAVLNAELDSGETVTEYGFYYSTEPGVTEADEKVIVDEGNVPVDDPRVFSASVTGLSDDTTYYFIAYVVDPGPPTEATILSLEEFSFTTAAIEDVSSDGDLEFDDIDADLEDTDEATLTAVVVPVDSDFDLDDYDFNTYGFFYTQSESDISDLADLDGLGDIDAIEDSIESEGLDIAFEDADDWDQDSDEFQFSVDLTGLDDDETYYYRAYVEYEYEGEIFYALSDWDDFDLSDYDSDDEGDSDKGAPDVTTDNATGIDADSATLNGTIESFGDDNEITEYGFYYGTTSSPSTKKMVGDDEDEIDEGDDFDYQLSNLKSGTKYYFKAYAKNSEGIAYGSVKSFTTKGSAAVTTSSVFTIGQSYYQLNGQFQAMDAAPYIKNSRTYLPIRYVGYAMGLTDSQIQWYESTRTVILTKGSTTVVLIIGSPTMFVNGQARTMDVSPEISNSRTCLPIAWVAAAFGYTATWNGSTQQVTISGVNVVVPPVDSEDDASGEVTVSTGSVRDVAYDSARIYGRVTDDGGLDIDELGFFYGTNRRDVADGEDGDADYDEARGSEGNFYLDLEDLDADETYYYMAYVIDENDDYTYGSVKSFTTDEE